MDQARIEAAVREILVAVGEDPNRDGLLDTPARVARSFGELLNGYQTDPADHLDRQFEVDHDEMVIVRDIPFSSLCEHHMLPFIGRAHVAYLPGADGKVCGLSKLARVVDGYAKRLQVQERLTVEVAEAMMQRLEARGVLVTIEAEHLCMTMRGVQKPGAMTTTSAVRGLLKTNAASRAEALGLIRG
ncbi:MAG: GTP cyclohydrolase I FolE [Acidimicrobiia bacterium]|nr:GTP cyclohydrolase I FolE [Acidimicrobiia bacterium]